MCEHNMQSDIIKNDAYLYIPWEGKLEVYKGDVYKDSGYFGTFVTDGRPIVCYSQPNIVCNGVVWLNEQNNSLAKHLLLTYHQDEIRIMEAKIKVKNKIISILKGDK